MINLEKVSPDNWRLDLHVRNDQRESAVKHSEQASFTKNACF
mgnify:CR=1 FL=1